MKISCVLFDFDGVVADTEPSNAKYLSRALATFGITLSEEDHARLVGINSAEHIDRLLARAPKPVTREAYLQERQRQGNTYENAPDLAVSPGLPAFLRTLRGNGVRTGLVTSTSARLILAALNRLSLTSLFDIILCGDMVARHKPDPECYRKAMQLLRVSPEECVVIEDSPVGIRAGIEAGATVIAYKGGQVRQDTHEAHFQTDSFADCAALPMFRFDREGT